MQLKKERITGIKHAGIGRMLYLTGFFVNKLLKPPFCFIIGKLTKVNGFENLVHTGRSTIARHSLYLPSHDDCMTDKN